jgi:hypothetical protein
MHRISDVRQIEIHRAGPTVSEPRHFQEEILIANLAKNKWLFIDQIPAKLIQAGGDFITV